MAKLLFVAFDAHEAVTGAAVASALGLPFDVLAFSAATPTNLGAEQILQVELADLPAADGLAKGIAGAVGYTHFAAVSSMRSKDVMARVAGLLNAAMVTDVVAVTSPTVFQRPMFAGTVLASVEVLAEPVVLTVRPAGFPAPEPKGESTVVPFAGTFDSRTSRVSASSRGGGRPELTQAKVVVSGGRPLKDAETFERIVGGLADALGGAVGATRAAVDSGIAANELQVGQTGKIVAPDLYIAAGISGSTQHMAGIKDSKVIVAINKDADAPIFEFADYGLVGDLYEVLPELQARVSKSS